MSFMGSMLSVPPWVPIETAKVLDPREFLPYEGNVASDAEALAEKLGVFIAVYQCLRPIGTTAVHLCQTYHTALLDADDVKLLRVAEDCHPGAVFVAYARPLRALTAGDGPHPFG
ncbi:MAG: hypothetical protein M3O36_07575 [Myxococcota bacterium]|nr:hypothetical protein [Myxococcota bacterium]